MNSKIIIEPLVSIIVPVYNGANFMREAIDSALAQTYRNIEVIVVNDGSTDNGATEKIALEYGDKIKYIYKENGGVSSALNTGIRAMSGDYFSWLSHDDVYTEDKIEKSVKALSHNADIIIYCSSSHIDKNSLPLNSVKSSSIGSGEYNWKNALMTVLKRGSLNGCALLIPKKAIVDCGMFDEGLRFNQDGFMWLKIFLSGYSLKVIEENCVRNRVHENQLTQKGQDIFRRDCLEMSNYLIPELIKISTSNYNFIVEYMKYNAKYGNSLVVKNAYIEANNKHLIGIKEKFTVLLLGIYGKIRPTVRKIYYRVIRNIKTS